LTWEFPASDICFDVSEHTVREQMKSGERDKQTTSQRGAKGVTISRFRKGRETPCRRAPHHTRTTGDGGRAMDERGRATGDDDRGWATGDGGRATDDEDGRRWEDMRSRILTL
jgi:hypothetical protein